MRTSITIRNFPCTALQSPVVLTSLKLAWSPLPCLPLTALSCFAVVVVVVVVVAVVVLLWCVQISTTFK